MKFSCEKNILEHALITAERFTGKNVTLPILANLMLSAEGSHLCITATNLEYAIRVGVPGRVYTAGEISVPARTATTLFQSLGDDQVTLEERKGNLHVVTASQQTRMNGLPTNDFPLIPKVKKMHYFRVDANALKQGLTATIPMVSLSDFKPELNGVLFQVSKNTLVLAATDTFRLAEKTIPLSDQMDEEGFSFILPHRVAQEIARAFVIDEPVEITIGENQALFHTGKTEIISRLVDGSFPEYRGIIPGDFSTSSHLKREHLASAIRASSIFASKLQDITLHFRNDNTLEVVSANTDIGEHKTTLTGATTGNDVALSFNHRYLLDGLNVLAGDELFVGCNEEHTPVLFQNREDTSLIYVLMPIKLS